MYVTRRWRHTIIGGVLSQAEMSLHVAGMAWTVRYRATQGESQERLARPSVARGRGDPIFGIPPHSTRLTEEQISPRLLELLRVVAA
jgi:hypothetical protein